MLSKPVGSVCGGLESLAAGSVAANELPALRRPPAIATIPRVRMRRTILGIIDQLLPEYFGTLDNTVLFFWLT